MRENRFGMMQHFLKGDFEPLGVLLRVKLNIVFQVNYSHVFPRLNFLMVDNWSVVALTDEHMVKLMFGETFSDGSLIYKGVDFVHWAGHAHLFHQTA